MAAEVFSANVKASSVFSLEKKLGGAYTIDATADAALAALTTANTVSDVLDILSENVKRGHVVSATGIGKASHVDAS